MIGNRMTIAGFVAAVLLSAVGAQAHHSAVMFEDKKEVTFEGTVKEFQFTNPHSWLVVNVTNQDGSVTAWGFEAEAPSALLRNGVHPGDFKPGTKLTITGRPMKDGRAGALWVKAVREDGAEFYPGGRPSSAAHP